MKLSKIIMVNVCQKKLINLLKVLDIKGLIKRSEAHSAAKLCGLKDWNIHFLDLFLNFEKRWIRENSIKSWNIKIHSFWNFT